MSDHMLNGLADHLRTVSLVGRAHGQPQAQADARPGMRGVKQVVLRLLRVCEAAQSAGLAQRRKALTTAREDLVHVALVADVPDAAVAAEVEDGVQGDGQLDHPQVASEVPTGALDGVQEKGADLLAQPRQLFPWKRLQVAR